VTSDRYKTLLLFGPPGAGKGTQGRLMGCIPGFRHVASGDIFRALVPESTLGRRVRIYSSRGDLVPDDLTIEIWRDHMRKLIRAGDYLPEEQLLVLDGIPRTVAQAEAMAGDIDVIGVIVLATPDIEPLVERLRKRALKEGRQDDADEGVIRYRFEVYDRETTPLLEHYAPELQHRVNAIATPAEVLFGILELAAPLQRRHAGALV
jgi:adenylate kinase